MTAQTYRTRKALEIAFRRFLTGTAPAHSLAAVLRERNPATYRAHLESQFAPGMDWRTYGRAWQVDHVVPLCMFDLADPSGVRLAWSLDNVRPLSVAENKVRGACAADSCVALRSRSPVCAAEHTLLLTIAETAFARSYPGITLFVSVI